MKTEITKSEYYQIEGLLTLSKQLMDKLQDFNLAIKEILDDREEYSHVDDGVFGGYTGKELLGKMKIKVK
jgi:hypothetical protein